MRYITLISSRTYQRPRLGCAPAGSGIFHSLGRPIRGFLAATCPLISRPARSRNAAAEPMRLVRYSAPTASPGPPMIKRYNDHAANERTFLSWVRTAIAVMAFGFVIERFDLFLQAMAPQLALKAGTPHSQTFAN